MKKSVRPGESKEQGLAWMRQRILEVVPSSGRGERLPVIIKKLLDSKGTLPFFGHRFRVEKFRRYAVAVMNELVAGGEVALDVYDRSGQLAKDHKGEPVEIKKALKLYRKRGLLEVLAWVSRDPEPQLSQPQERSAPTG